ncbi:FRO2 [Symbiodinium sp. CCMP2592]|nr:FRO2 [Symbiodinium sp. CCMP2592]
MIKPALFRLLQLCAYGLTLGITLCIALGATWDGVSPCSPCYHCYKCGDILNSSCKAWNAWEDSWDFDLWPLVWMGSSALVIMLLPWIWQPAAQFLGACMHVINLLWLVMLAAPLSWRQRTDVDSCHKAYPLAYIGSATGRMCGINLCLLLISAGRSSAWLRKFGTAFTEGISIHRIAGWWCVAHATLHSAAFVLYYWFEGGWFHVFQHLVPVNTGAQPNFSGMMNFYGALSMIAGLVLAMFSTPYVRRRMYGMFYSIHLITSVAFIVFGALHDFGILLYTLPACSYIIERVHAKYRRTTCRAQVELLSPMLVKLSLGSSAQPVLAPGTRWLYIKIPCIGREWHPFSITRTADSVVMHIKSAGDWSKRLCTLAQSSNEVDLLADGPYGMAEVPRRMVEILQRGSCLPGGPPSGSLLLIAGGVGIVPFADLLDSRLGMWSAVTIIWAVRSESEFDALDRSLGVRGKARGRLQLQVYITQPATSGPLRSQPLLGGRSGPLHLESGEDPASQMQISAESDPNQGMRFQLALKSQLLTGLLPGLVLLLTLEVYDNVILDWVDRQPWRDNPFLERLVVHGGIIVLAYAMLGASAMLLAAFIYAFWGAAGRARSCFSRKVNLLQDDESTAPLRDPHVVPAASQEFLIKEGRPDLHGMVGQLAQQATTLSVHACGPSPLLDAVRKSVSCARAAGRKVTLQIEQAEW